MKKLLQQWFAYNQATNHQFLELAAALSHDQLTADHGYGHGSILATLHHLLETETVWRQLAYAQRISEPFLELGETTTVTQLEEACRAETAKLLAQVDGYSEADLGEMLVLIDRAGQPHRLQRAQMLTHLLNHSMQHRSEIAVWLTQFGQSPGDVDLIYFYEGVNLDEEGEGLPDSLA